MSSEPRTTPLDRLRGSLVAAIDLENPASWLGTSGLERVPPATLISSSTDPQIAFVCPPALTERLAGTRMEIVLESADEGVFQVYWDLGTGYVEEQSERCTLRSASCGRQAVWITLPPGIVGLRVDPLEEPGRVTLCSIRFYEPEPAGASYFPFEALKAGKRSAHSWIEFPEVQQIVSRRLMGSSSNDWPEWLFRRLILGRTDRCLHLGAHDLTFGSIAVESGYVRNYFAVPYVHSPLDAEAPAAANVRWISAEEAAGAGAFDLVLSTGYFSSRSDGGLAASKLTALARGAVVLLERFPLGDRSAETALARYLALSAQTLPPGWTEASSSGASLGTWYPDEEFCLAFHCHEVRPLGGTLVEPLFERLPKAFYGLGAFTMLGTVAATYLLLEETLILTGVLPSAFNLVVAVPRAGQPLALARPAMGWSVPAARSFDRTSLSREQAVDALTAIADRDDGAAPIAGHSHHGRTRIGMAAAGMNRNARSYLRRALRRLARLI